LIGKVDRLDIENIRGIGKRYPFISTSIILALFCLAGMPLLAGFPLKLGVIEGLSEMVPQISIWVIIGSFGLIIAGIRTMIAIVSGESGSNLETPEPRIMKIFLAIGWLLLVLLGILPNFFLQMIINLPAAFAQMGPLS
jgi:formate hydrogenlyase subunit 3/multisubunit Na+/H+ antiporter MnhD subunit